MQMPPKPETKEAVLPSEGCNRATRHVWIDTNAAHLGDEPIWEFLFQCQETGAIRRWGILVRSEVN